jgi:hypothetical protein
VVILMKSAYHFVGGQLVIRVSSHGLIQGPPVYSSSNFRLPAVPMLLGTRDEDARVSQAARRAGFQSVPQHGRPELRPQDRFLQRALLGLAENKGSPKPRRRVFRDAVFFLYSLGSASA